MGRVPPVKLYFSCLCVSKNTTLRLRTRVRAVFYFYVSSYKSPPKRFFIYLLIRIRYHLILKRPEYFAVGGMEGQVDPSQLHTQEGLDPFFFRRLMDCF